MLEPSLALNEPIECGLCVGHGWAKGCICMAIQNIPALEPCYTSFCFNVHKATPIKLHHERKESDVRGIWSLFCKAWKQDMHVV